MCTNQLSSGAFVHSEEMSVDPIPVVILVGIINSHPDPHLRLAPKSRPVGASKSCRRTEVGELQLAIGAIENDFGAFITSRCVVGGQFESYPLGRRHPVFSRIFSPISTSVHAVGSSFVISLIIPRNASLIIATVLSK